MAKSQASLLKCDVPSGVDVPDGGVVMLCRAPQRGAAFGPPYARDTGQRMADRICLAVVTSRSSSDSSST